MTVSYRLIGVALVLSAATSGPSGFAQDKDKPEKRGTICPIYKAAQFEDYCTYYAFECPSKPVAYNHQECNLPSANCTTGLNCFPLLLRDRRGPHSHPDVIRDGLSRPYPPAVNPSLEKGVDIVDRLKVQFRDGANTLIKAKLFLIKVAREEPTAYFGIGVEITSGADFTEVKDVQFDGKVAYLEVGDVSYTVVLHTAPRALRKEQPMATSPSQPKSLPKSPPAKALPKGPPQDGAGRETGEGSRETISLLHGNFVTPPKHALRISKHGRTEWRG